MTTQPALLPCPFCNRKADLIFGQEGEIRFVKIACRLCAISMTRTFGVNVSDEKLVADLIKLWNTRPAATTDEGRLRDLRGLARMVWLLAFNDDYTDEERLLGLRRNSPLMQELDSYFELCPWTDFDKTVRREKFTEQALAQPTPPACKDCGGSGMRENPAEGSRVIGYEPCPSCHPASASDGSQEAKGEGKVRRFHPPNMSESPNGFYVLYEDYAKLKSTPPQQGDAAMRSSVDKLIKAASDLVAIDDGDQPGLYGYEKQFEACEIAIAELEADLSAQEGGGL